MRSGTSTSLGTNNPSTQYMQRSTGHFAGRQNRRPFRRTGGGQRSTINNNTRPATQPCGYCRRLGHDERECHTKHRDQQRNNRPPRAHLQQVEEPSPSQYGMETLQLFSSHIHSNDALIPHSTVATSEWLLDTGATHHHMAATGCQNTSLSHNVCRFTLVIIIASHCCRSWPHESCITERHLSNHP